MILQYNFSVILELLRSSYFEELFHIFLEVSANIDTYGLNQYMELNVKITEEILKNKEIVPEEKHYFLTQLFGFWNDKIFLSLLNAPDTIKVKAIYLLSKIIYIKPEKIYQLEEQLESNDFFQIEQFPFMKLVQKILYLLQNGSFIVQTKIISFLKISISFASEQYLLFLLNQNIISSFISIIQAEDEKIVLKVFHIFQLIIGKRKNHADITPLLLSQIEQFNFNEALNEIIELSENSRINATVSHVLNSIAELENQI